MVGPKSSYDSSAEPFGTSSVNELQLGDGALEDTSTGFFDDVIAAPDY